MTNPNRWPWHCGVCGSHAESYTEEGARAALHEHFQFHPAADRRPVEVAMRAPTFPPNWWKENEAAILGALRDVAPTRRKLQVECSTCHAPWEDGHTCANLPEACPHPEPFYRFPEGTKYEGRLQCMTCGALVAREWR